VSALRVLFGSPRSVHPLESTGDEPLVVGVGWLPFHAGCATAEKPVVGLGHAVGFVTAASLTRASERTVTSHRVWHCPRIFERVIALLELSVRCRSLTARR
jgi:hypothetical protein